MLSGSIWFIIAAVIAVTLQYRYIRFYKVLEAERSMLPDLRKPSGLAVITSDSIGSYPAVVQLWLTRSGVLNRAFNGPVELSQQGKMRTGANGRWMPVKATQWFNTSTPGFLWAANVKILPLLHLSGKDSYINGKGHMLISFLSAIPLVNARGPEIDESSMIRYLAEIVWFPFAAVSNYIKWEEVDTLTARATITFGGVSASALFRFNDAGDFTGLEAKRYYTRNGRSSLEDWLIETEPGAYRTFEGIRVPERLQVSWQLPAGRFTWFLLKITGIKYYERLINTFPKPQHHGSFSAK